MNKFIFFISNLLLKNKKKSIYNFQLFKKSLVIFIFTIFK